MPLTPDHENGKESDSGIFTVNREIKMNHLGILLLTSTLALASGCTTIVESINEDPVTLDNNDRTWGSWIDDKTIETVAGVNIIKADPTFKELSRVKVISYNGIVLLIGQVPDENFKQLAGDTVSHIEQVRKVYNELEIGDYAGIMIQSSDSWITTKIKTTMTTSSEHIAADQIKVNTEGGTVYLMGLVSPKAAQEAVDISRNTRGVKKVVKAFEYIR